MIDSLLFSHPQKLPSFYLVTRTITIVEVVLLCFTVVELDLKYLVEFANCSSWMVFIVIVWMSEQYLYQIYRLMLQYISISPVKFLIPKMEMLIKVLEKQQ